MTNPSFLIQVCQISKHFPGVQALDKVSLVQYPGEVLAVVGENGAGKSTLMKILAGVYQPDEGQIRLNGIPVRFENVADALQAGISLIHQELNLAENLSVAANLFLGRELIRGSWLGLLKKKSMNQAAREQLGRLGLECSPTTRVGALTPGQRQMVEIAHALALQARVLIMDEPTSSLTQRETERLFEVVDKLKREGVGVIYVSHRLAEVRRIADRVVVLRDGKNAGELTRSEICHANLVRLMVGRELNQFFQKQHGNKSNAGQPRLQIRDLLYRGGPSTPVSLQVHGGEILGFAGLVGAGRSELAEALFGLRRVISGQVFIDGTLVDLHNPRQGIAAGMLLVPEDRRHHGLVLDDTVQHNIGLPNLDTLGVLGMVRRNREIALANETCGRLTIRTPSIRQVVGLLSGGNQQKVVLGKWLARKPKILIFDEPTRGIDVGAKSQIYALMDQLAEAGVAILMISSDLEEILGMSDRVAVMHQGRMAGVLNRDQFSEQAIMHLATGGSLSS